MKFLIYFYAYFFNGDCSQITTVLYNRNDSLFFYVKPVEKYMGWNIDHKINERFEQGNIQAIYLISFHDLKAIAQIDIHYTRIVFLNDGKPEELVLKKGKVAK